MDIRKLIIETYLDSETKRITAKLQELDEKELRELLQALRVIVKKPIDYAIWSEELSIGSKNLKLADVVLALGELGLVDYSLNEQDGDFMGIQATEVGKAVCGKLR